MCNDREWYKGVFEEILPRCGNASSGFSKHSLATKGMIDRNYSLVNIEEVPKRKKENPSRYFIDERKVSNIFQDPHPR